MLNKRLKNLRNEADLTQKEFASKFNMSDARYNQYETGKRTPDYETLQMFADYFNVSVDYLLGRTDIKSPYNSKNTTQPEEDYQGDMFKEIDDLSEESKKELERYIQLLKMKDQLDKTKEEQSSTLEKEA